VIVFKVRPTLHAATAITLPYENLYVMWNWLALASLVQLRLHRHQGVVLIDKTTRIGVAVYISRLLSGHPLALDERLHAI
jgi:hypothetical protein